MVEQARRSLWCHTCRANTPHSYYQRGTGRSCLDIGNWVCLPCIARRKREAYARKKSQKD